MIRGGVGTKSCSPLVISPRLVRVYSLLFCFPLSFRAVLPFGYSYSPGAFRLKDFPFVVPSVSGINNTKLYYYFVFHKVRWVNVHSRSLRGHFNFRLIHVGYKIGFDGELRFNDPLAGFQVSWVSFCGFRGPGRSFLAFLVLSAFVVLAAGSSSFIVAAQVEEFPCVVWPRAEGSFRP